VVHLDKVVQQDDCSSDWRHADGIVECMVVVV